ncbi:MULTISPECIES: DUF4124 domain-containing protein [Shewanella]|uniref:DUF4124 domain-containing protein n=1 Tax=Shewanella TaxID=22 RepID=UPI00167951BB|nr:MULTISPECIES: DUF4124 domain-containing protein [Shewanella]MBO1270106.1 hypothetical protein [Shewanella sp. 4t3-1-2LB]MCL2905243.1 hypothetical protein [Shewanella fodinae]
MDGIKLIAFVILVATPICQANVYKCIVDGKVIFSQEPCADNATPVDLSKVGSVVGAQRQTDAAQSSVTTAATGDNHTEIANYIKAQDLNRQISKLEYQRQQVFKARDAKLDKLRHQKNYASNNLAGATWEQSISQEMQSITSAADSQVVSIDRQIASLQQQLNGLR